MSEIAKDLIEHIRSELAGRGLEFSSVRTLSPWKDTPDDPSKLLLERAEGAPSAILLVSPGAAPDVVKRRSDRARESAKLLGEGPGAAVLLPELEGVFAGRSYAVIRWQRPLSKSRLVWPVQRIGVRRRVFSWLADALRVSMRDVPQGQLEAVARDPLQRMAVDTRYSSSVRKDAEVGLKRLDDGSWHPKLVLAHNDLWKGNILLPARFKHGPENPYGIWLIDWGSAETAGFAFWDFGRLCLSLKPSTLQARREALRHCRILGCKPADSVGYLLLAAEHLDARREHFAEERFLAMFDMVHRLLSGLLRAHRANECLAEDR